jgi:hypothetical protein
MHVCNAGQESRPGKYLSGDKLSHADLAVFCQLSALHCGWLDGEQRDWPELWGVIRAWACPMGQSISTCQLLMPGSREVFMLSNCSVLHMVSHQQEPGSSNQGVFGSASMQQQCSSASYYWVTHVCHQQCHLTAVVPHAAGVQQRAMQLICISTRCCINCRCPY